MVFRHTHGLDRLAAFASFTELQVSLAVFVFHLRLDKRRTNSKAESLHDRNIFDWDVKPSSTTSHWSLYLLLQLIVDLYQVSETYYVTVCIMAYYIYNNTQNRIYYEDVFFILVFNVIAKYTHPQGLWKVHFCSLQLCFCTVTEILVVIIYQSQPVFHVIPIMLASNELAKFYLDCVCVWKILIVLAELPHLINFLSFLQWETTSVTFCFLCHTPSCFDKKESTLK